MTVVLVGLAYYPCRSASDKNFMRDVAIAASRDHGVDLVLVSVAENRGWAPPAGERDAFADIFFVPRPFHSARRDSTGTLAHPRHGRLREYAERTVAAVALIPLLRRLRDDRGARYVHFFDNLGPGAAVAARSLGLRCGVTILGSNTAERRGLRRVFWRASTTGVHDVVAGSEALRDELEGDGVAVRDVIPWGPSRTLMPHGPAYAERKTVVWTGPLGSSGPFEARLTARAMALARRRLPEMRPCVWPKPEYVHEYTAIARESGVDVETPGRDFLRMLGEAKILVSPVADAASLVRPDLTWLEAAQLGATVVTTPCRGLDDTLIRAGSVVVAAELSVVALADAIVQAWESSGPNLDGIWTADAAAKRYVRLWKDA
jgi:hypothetical protein